MSKTILIVISAFLVCVVVGCTGGRFVVKKNPDKADEGFRYFAAKPYLLICGNEGKIIYLPNFDEEYSVTVESGTAGTFKGSLKIEDGWKLTEVNQEHDLKTKDTIDALAGTVTSIIQPGVNKGPKKEVKVSFLLYEIDIENRELIQIGKPIEVEVQGNKQETIQEEDKTPEEK